MSFAELKKNRTKKLDALVDAAEKESSQGGYARDERFWQPTVDKAGNGYAVIRFLPEAEDNPLPWAKYWSHGFKGPTGLWYIENSLTSIGQEDPVAELNTKMWNQNDNENCPLKELVRRERKRRLHYVSNIMVISDKENPENEGKVFLYKYGKKIHDKIMNKMKPEFEDEVAMNPFDFWEGANFRLKIRKVDGQRNYDRSEFDSPSELSDDDSELEEIYNKMYDLREFTDPTSYKSYDELKARLATVLGESVESAADADLDPDDQEEAPSLPEKEPAQSTATPAESDDAGDKDLEDEDDAMSYFSKLAKEID